MLSYVSFVYLFYFLYTDRHEFSLDGDRGNIFLCFAIVYSYPTSIRGLFWCAIYNAENKM